MLTKKELIDKIAKVGEITKVDAEKALNNVTDGIKAAVIEDGGCMVRDFGTFERVVRAARTGRNPSTGGTIQIPEKLGVKFKAGKVFKDELND